jgi:hypothetical protein
LPLGNDPFAQGIVVGNGDIALVAHGVSGVSGGEMRWPVRGGSARRTEAMETCRNFQLEFALISNIFSIFYQNE